MPVKRLELLNTVLRIYDAVLGYFNQALRISVFWRHPENEEYYYPGVKISI